MMELVGRDDMRRAAEYCEFRPERIGQRNRRPDPQRASSEPHHRHPGWIGEREEIDDRAFGDPEIFTQLLKCRAHDSRRTALSRGLNYLSHRGIRIIHDL